MGDGKTIFAEKLNSSFNGKLLRLFRFRSHQLIVVGRQEIRFVLNHVIDADKHHPADRNNCFLVPAAFLDTTIFDSKISVLIFNSSESTLNKQRLEIQTGTGDSG